MEDPISDDYVRKLDELERLLNDPDVPMQPALIWHLLDELAKWEHHDRPTQAPTAGRESYLPLAAD
jgi:hypothetical protein